MKASIKYVCQHCLEVVTTDHDGFLSSVTVLICPRCEKPTQIRLYKPMDFEAHERVRKQY